MGERVLKNPFSRWLGFCSASQYRAAHRIALALLKMGKKSRRPARQDKRTEKKPTLDDLDEHTAKPAPPLRAEEVYAKAYMARNPRPEDPSAYHTYTNGMIASWRVLSERGRRPYVSRASEMRRVFEETVAFCAKSGPALVGELFLDCPHGPRRQSARCARRPISRKVWKHFV